MTISLWHSDLVFDSTRQSLYAVISNDLSLPPKIAAVAAASRQVQDLVAPSDPPPYTSVDPAQATLSLSAQAQYRYFTTTGGAVSRVDLASSAVDLTVPAHEQGDTFGAFSCCSDLHFAIDRLERKPCQSCSNPAKSFSPNPSEDYCDPQRFPYAKARLTFLR